MLKAKTFYIAIAMIVSVAGAFFIFSQNKFTDTNANDPGNYPEIEEIQRGSWTSFEDLKKYFQDLANEKTARYAFRVLELAPIPPNTDMHLLGHAVGDILYEQEGLEGIKACNDNFRNACSHSIVIGLFSDEGEAAFPLISKACREAPGGSGAYTMCFHGLGHGILAASGYDMAKTVYYCNKTGTSEYGHNEAHQCISGAVMEIVGGGGHDRNIWTEQRAKYLKKNDPLELCRGNLIPDPARYLCFVYITPFMLESVGASQALPVAEDFKKAFPFCNKLPAGDRGNRDACYGGFGKEFVGLVQSRDIRKDAINQISDEQLRQVYEWCKLADSKEGSAACMIHGMNSLYWGGENDYKISIRYCGLMDDPYFRSSCFKNLMGAASFYMKNADYLHGLCGDLPSEYQKECHSMMSQAIKP